MGISIVRNSNTSNCGCNGCSTKDEQPLSNPNPNRWQINRHVICGDYIVVDIHYPDCINFEGKKILVFKCGWSQLAKQKLIDPHFSDKNDKLYPIARFQPTREGWDDAINYAKSKS